jgi:hypothetical protein
MLIPLALQHGLTGCAPARPARLLASPSREAAVHRQRPQGPPAEASRPTSTTASWDRLTGTQAGAGPGAVAQLPRFASERKGVCIVQRAARACGAGLFLGQQRPTHGRARHARGRPSRRAQRSSAARAAAARPDMLNVVGLGLGDRGDITVKGLEALPFKAFDSAVGHGAQEFAAQTAKRSREGGKLHDEYSHDDTATQNS